MNDPFYGIACTICYTNLEEGPHITLSNCKCTFHTECVGEYVDNCIKELNLEILCPEAGCGATMTHFDLKQVIPKERFDRYLDLVLDQAIG